MRISTYLRDVRRMSPNTIESYARDLAQLAASRTSEARPSTPFSARISRLRPAADVVRAGAAFGRARGRMRRGFYRFIAVEQKRDSSPADDLRPPRAWAALPKFLSLDEVDRLLEQPDTATARGLTRQGADRSALRDRAAGVGAHRAARRRSNLDEGYLTCIGKGDKQRMVPLGHEAGRLGAPVHPRWPAGAAAQEALAVAVRQRARRRPAFARRLLEGAEGVRTSRRASRAISVRTCSATPLLRTCSSVAPTCA